MAEFDDNLTPMQIWGMVFHPSKGAVATINKSIKDLCDEMKLLENNLKKYNGLPERVQRVEKAVKDQQEFCKQVQHNITTTAEKEAAVEQALEEAREKGVREERDRFKRATIIVGLVFTGIGVLTGFITWFMDLWNF